MSFTEAEAQEMLERAIGGRAPGLKRPWDKLSKQPSKKRDNSEDWLSAAVNMWLDLPEVKIRGMAFHVPNETASKAEAGRKKWIGVKAGVADWIFTGPPLVAIELKDGKNRQSVAQKKWGKGLEAGWDSVVEMEWDKDSYAPRYRVCRSLRVVVRELVEPGIVSYEGEFPELASKLILDSIEKVRTWFAVQYGREIP